MATRVTVMAVLLGLALVATACAPLRVLDPDRRAHDAAVRDLAALVDQEDGWVVVTLPNLHEGGGTSTWWLAPCDPDVDAERAATVTAFHGSDVATLPGRYEVTERTTPCADPGTQVTVDDHVVTLDVDAIPLTGSIALLAPREHLELTDDTGARTRVELGTPARTTCEGGTRWVAWLESSVELLASVQPCAGTLAALPEEVRSRLVVHDDGDRLAEHRAGVDDHEVALAFEAAGWDPGPDALRDPAGALFTDAWRGPCHLGVEVKGAPEDGSRTVASQLGGLVEVDVEPCRS